jgi:hypothetical protein
VKRALGIFVVVLAAAAAFGTFMPEAFAQTTTPATTTPVSTCSQYAGVTNRVVMCVRESLDSVAEKFFDGFYPLVRQAITGFLTLGVIIYGIMAAYGMLEKISRDLFMLAIKLSMITFFVVNVNLMYDALIGMMDEMATVVVAYTPGNGTVNDGSGEQEVTCLTRMVEASADADAGYSAPWLGMDCLIDSVIGIHIPTSASNITLSSGMGKEYWNNNLEGKGMSRGLISVFFSSMSTSIIGIIIAIIGFIFIYSLMFLIAKALFSYIMGYIGIVFMMIFAPLFIPLALFRKTKEYFDKWLKLTVSFALQPVLILLFVTFSITAVDLAVFSGDYSIMYRLAGDASRQQGFSLPKYLHDNGIINKNSMTLAQIRTPGATPDEFTIEKGTYLNNDVNIDCSKKAMENSAARAEFCKQFYAIKMWKDQIDWDKAAQLRQPAVTVDSSATTTTTSTPATSSAIGNASSAEGKQLIRELITATIFATIVVFVMNGLLNIVPVIANGLIGEEMQSPSLFAEVSRSAGGIRGPGSAISSMIRRGR